MKKALPLLVLIIALGSVVAILIPHKAQSDYDLDGFGKLPVLANGRIKPIDSLARNSLLVLQNRQRVGTPDGKELVATPIEWLLDVCFRPELADTYPTFAIDNTSVLSLLDKTEDSLRITYDRPALRVLSLFGFVPSRYRRFPYNEISPYLEKIDQQAKLAEAIDSEARNPFQRAILALQTNLISYQRLKYTFVMPDSPDFLSELTKVQDDLPKGVAAARAKQAGKPADEAVLGELSNALSRFDFMANAGFVLAVPPAESEDKNAWINVGHALSKSFEQGRIDTNALAFAGLGHAWKLQQPEHFNKLVELYTAELAHGFAPQLKKVSAEVRFNNAEPFYLSMQLYGVAFAFAIFSWLLWPEALGKSAFYLVAVAWILATAGILARMLLEGRPPVTNLYSSALFVGWGAVLLCLILEGFYKNAIGSAAGSAIGFCTLLIAHHLALGGDTLEMMRAVLDSNFWLATHVVVVTTGYASTFLAGFLAIIYIFRGVFTESFDKQTAQSLNRMVYGIVCFATLFSLVGTVLGGIWADQSWGRFWGWDPKENGALIIVLWNAILLHARWGGLVKARGLMALAVFGNIVTSWSWFGVNMLGIGLHNYGFMDGAFQWLATFVLSQLAIIAIALTPLEKWRSFKSPPGSGPTGSQFQAQSSKLAGSKP